MVILQSLNRYVNHSIRRGIRRDIHSIGTLAIPLILTNFAHVALTTVDIVMVGRLGATDIAAVGLALVLFNQLRTTGTGLVTGVSNLVAEARAKADHQRINDLLVAGFFWATMTGIVFAAILLLIHQPLLWLGQDGEVVAKTIQFLMVTAIAMLPCLWFQTLRHFTVGLKHPGPLLTITVFSVLVTIALNYILIYGKLGLPAYGFMGIAITNSIVFLLSFLFFLATVIRHRELRQYFSVQHIRLSAQAVKDVWKLGLPIAGTYASEAGFFSVLTLLIGTLGMQALAAQTVLNQIIYIIFMISAGISHAASVNISEACGNKNYTHARQLGILALTLGTLAMLIVAIGYVVIPEAIVSVFISAEHESDAAVMALITTGLMVAIVLQLFDAAQNIGIGILRGIGDTAGPFRLSLLGYWVIGLPASYLLGISAGHGIYGVWIGQTIGLACTSILLILSFRSQVHRLELNSSTLSSEKHI